MPLFNDIPSQYEANNDGTAKILSTAPDNASAIGTIIDTSTAYSTAGAKLLSVRNAGYEISSIDKYGNAVFGEIYVGYGPRTPDTYPTWLVGSTYALGDEVVYQYRHYRSLQAANTGNTPPAVSDAWWQYFPLSNLAVGSNAFAGNTTGLYNTAIGTEALATSSVGLYNTAIGYQALQNQSKSVSVTEFHPYNYYIITFVGNTDWTNEFGATGYVGEEFLATGPGTGTGMAAPKGRDNIAIGFQALKNAYAVDEVVAIGNYAAMSMGGGHETTVVGFKAAMLTSGDTWGNTVFGHRALENNTTGTNNNAFGKLALKENIFNGDNVAVGNRALELFGGPISADALIVGRSYEIIFVGDIDWTLLGAASNTVGQVFTASDVGPVGTGICANNDSINNTVVGAEAGSQWPYGAWNVVIGANAGAHSTGGDHNVVVGAEAFYLSSGSDNVAIGYNASNPSAFSNSIVIGANAQPTKDNQVVLGNADIVELATHGDLVSFGGALYMSGLPAAPTTAPTYIGQSSPGPVQPGDWVYRVRFGWYTDIITPTGTIQYSSITAVGPISDPITVVTAGGMRIELDNVPVSPDPRVTFRQLFRAPAGTTDSSNAWMLLEYLPDNESTYYVDVVGPVQTGVVCTTANPDAAFFSTQQNPCIQLNNDGSTTISSINVNNGLEFLSSISQMLWIDPMVVQIDGMSVGAGAGRLISNTVVGANAFGANVTGIDNVAIGSDTLQQNVDGNNNVAVGYHALIRNMYHSDNTAIGRRALDYTEADNNTALGSAAGRYNLAGAASVFIGSDAGAFIGQTVQPTVLRVGAQYRITVVGDTDWVAIGAAEGILGEEFTATAQGTGTGEASPVASYNVIIGAGSAGSMNDGANNTFIGTYSGSSHVSGDSNTFVGMNTTGQAPNDSSSVVIGFGAVGHGSNTATIGDTNTTATYLYGTLYVDDAPLGPGSGPTYGTSTLDFGAAPGTNQVELAVTGLTGITAGATPKVWINYEASPSHTADEQLLLSQFMNVMAGNVVAGTGFTIYAVAPYIRVSGEIKVRWSY
jgi:hypothetical protein